MQTHTHRRKCINAHSWTHMESTHTQTDTDIQNTDATKPFKTHANSSPTQIEYDTRWNTLQTQTHNKLTFTAIKTHKWHDTGACDGYKTQIRNRTGNEGEASRTSIVPDYKVDVRSEREGPKMCVAHEVLQCDAFYDAHISRRLNK